MADKRITELNALTTLNNADELVVSDTSATETKKITVANFKTNVVGSAHTVQNNGTGLTQRTNLNFDGTHVIATDDSGNNQSDITLSANLQAVSGLTSAANKGIQFTGSGTAGVYDLTAAGKALLDDADAAAQRTTLGLGALATAASVTTSQIAAGTLVTESETIGSNDNDTTIPTSAAVKAYADSVGGASGHKFTTIAVAGQNNVVADTSTDTLTLAAGSNVTLTTNDGTDTVTIAASGTISGDVVGDTTPQLGGNLDVNGQTITSASNGNVDIDPNGTGDILLGNNTQVDGATDYLLWNAPYTAEGDLPSATDYHGMFAHVHGTGRFYGSHAGNWIKLRDEATTLVNADISGTAAIALSKLATTTASRALVSSGTGAIAVSDVTSTEIGYLDGVSSAIQTQLDAKQATISASARLNANLIHDGTISNTEFGYLNGLTGNIQTQIDAAGTTLAGLSDTGISSANAGQVLLHDGTDSFDNKDIDFFGTTLNYTAKLALFMGGHIYTVASVDGSSHYVFSGYNADGTNANDPSLYVIAGHTYIFDLAYANGSHPFAIRTGGSASSGGTNLVSGNGGNNLIHISTNGTVTTGTSANAKSSGYLIWKVPHFAANQHASTGDYHYQCTAHAAMFGQIFIMSVSASGGSFA